MVNWVLEQIRLMEDARRTGSRENMNWSFGVLGEVPLEVTILMSTVPDPGGLMALSELSLTGVRPVAAWEPNLTAVAFASPVPVIVTGVPPAEGPLLGEIPDTVGAPRTAV